MSPYLYIRNLGFCTACVMGLFSFPLSSQPTGMQTVHGEAKALVLEEKNSLQIEVSDKAILEWKDFSIQKGETTNFILPSATSSVLNRVMSKNLSAIDGLLESNGRVFLINPQGIIVGKEGLVKTAGFYASTLNVANEDFLLENEMLFSGEKEGAIINLGHIEAMDGDVVILARQIENRGTIEAKKGEVLLAAGREILLKPLDKEKVFIKLQKGNLQKEGIGINNTGSIQAIKASLQADGNLYALAIKDGGKIDALGSYEKGGEIFLIAEDGEVESSSTLKAHNGGDISLLGERVKVLDGATLDASSDARGGNILIGGDYQGLNPLVLSSKAIYVGEGVQIDASAKKNGDGGKVILWSDESTTFMGNILAEGKGANHQGGFVELSSRYGSLVIPGYVSTLCEGGKTGQLLLDPSTIRINAVGPTSPPFSNPYNPPGDAVVLNTVIQTALISNAVTIYAHGNIVWESGAPISWSSGLPLVLNAPESLEGPSNIIINSGLTATNGTGRELIFINTIDDTSHRGGDVTIGDGTQTSDAFLDSSGGAIIIQTDKDINIFSSPTHSAYIIGRNDADVDLNLNLGGNLNIEADPAGPDAYIKEIFSPAMKGNIGIGGNGENGVRIHSSPNGAAYILNDSGSTEFFLTTLQILASSNGKNAYIRNSHKDISIERNWEQSPQIFLQGGDNNSAAFIEHTGEGSIILSGDRLSLIAGKSHGPSGGKNSSAYIHHSGTGNMNIDMRTQGILLQGGSDIDAFTPSVDDLRAYISHTGAAGNVSVTTTGDLQMLAGTGSGTNANSSVFIEATGPLSITGTKKSSLEQRGGMYQSLSYISSSSPQNLVIAMGSISLYGGNNPAPSAAKDSSAFIQQTGTGNLSITTTSGDLYLQGSEVLSSVDTTDAYILSSGGGDIILSVDDALILNGGTTAGQSEAYISATGGGDITFSSHTLSMEGGLITLGLAGILTDTGNITGDIDHTMVMTSQIAEAAITSGGALQIHSGGDMTLLANGVADSKITSVGSMEISTADSIILQGSGPGRALFSTSYTDASEIDNLLVKAALDLQLGSQGSITNTGGGSVALVVDDQFPEDPQMGHGRFITASGALITTSGPLRIFTSHQEFNDIQSLLNGAPFTPNPFFTNDGEEQWNTYYPSFLGGAPFTVFYKNEVKPEDFLLPLVGLASSELSFRLENQRINFWILDYQERFLREKKFRTTYSVCPRDQFRTSTNYAIKIGKE